MLRQVERQGSRFTAPTDVRGQEMRGGTSLSTPARSGGE
jgi:hypothetical protein